MMETVLELNGKNKDDERVSRTSELFFYCVGQYILGPKRFAIYDSCAINLTAEYYIHV